MLIEQGAVIQGPSAALLSMLLRAQNVKVIIERLPPWARPYRGEIAAAVDAVHRAASAWAPEDSAPEREDADPVSADGSESTLFVGSERVATLLGCSRRTAQELAARGAIPAERIGRSWVFDEQAVRLLAAARRAA